MDVPGLDDFAIAKKMMQEVNKLSKAENIDQKLPKDSLFGTIANFSEINGNLEEKTSSTTDGRFKSTSWEGLDENNISSGYLSHNGTNLRLHTLSKTVFDYPFNELKIEPHALGLVISLPANKLIVGNFSSINEQYSPDKKMRVTFGSESVIWMRELGQYNAVDKISYEKSRKNSKVFLIIWFSVIAAISILVIVMSQGQK